MLLFCLGAAVHADIEVRVSAKFIQHPDGTNPTFPAPGWSAGPQTPDITNPFGLAVEIQRANQILDRISNVVTDVLGPMNERMQRRYARYGAFEPETFPMRFHKEILAYKAERGNPAHSETPRFDIVTEVPDEVAVGDFLAIAARAGLEVSLAIARYLSELDATAERSYYKTSTETVLRIERSRSRRGLT